MKLPVNFLLYTATAGLLGLAGWTFYEAHLEGSWATRERAFKTGIDEARDKISSTKPQVVSAAWQYDTAVWQRTFLAPNLIGAEPKRPEEQVPVTSEPVALPVDMTPLEEIIELLSLVHDAGTDGKGGRSHVIVRYRDTANVIPPEWWELQNAPPLTGVPSGRGPADAIGNMRGPQGRPQTGRPRAGRPAPTSPVPGAAGREIVQRVWAAGDGSPKFEATLWPPHDHIRLVRVGPDARVAWFVRDQPAPPDGAPAQEPEPEPLYKSTLQLSQEVMRAVAEVTGSEPEQMAAGAAAPEIGAGQWQDVEETTRINGIYHVGRQDRDLFEQDPNTLLNRVQVDAYRSPTGSGLRGLRVMNVAPDIRSRFGVQQGDLVLAVNGEPVSTKAQAISVGKRLYKRGVRRFEITFLSNGEEVVRSYQAPDR